MRVRRMAGMPIVDPGKLRTLPRTAFEHFPGPTIGDRQKRYVAEAPKVIGAPGK